MNLHVSREKSRTHLIGMPNAALFSSRHQSAQHRVSDVNPAGVVAIVAPALLTHKYQVCENKHG